MRRPTDWLLGLGAGSLLAMLHTSGGLLAKHSSPLFASWVIHAVASVVAFAIVLAGSISGQGTRREVGHGSSVRANWLYLGGVLGSLTVLLAAITVNSILGLSGTLALMILGQIIFSILSDHFGLFGMAERKANLRDLLVVTCVLTGSGILIWSS